MEIELDEKSILNLTLKDIRMTCEERQHLYKDHNPCQHCPFHNNNTKGCLAQEMVTNKHPVGGGAYHTCWNSQQGPDGYRLQFETDDETLYKYMEKTAQMCIDIAHRFPHFKKKKKIEEEK